MGPYGIPQVNIPGVLSAYQDAQMRRSQQMLANRQMKMSERQMDRDSQFRNVLARGLTVGQGGVAGYVNQLPEQRNSAVQTPMSGTMGEIPEQSAGAPTAAPPPAAGQGTTFQLSPQLMTELIALDPEQAGNVIQAFSRMNEAQNEQSQRVNTTIGRAAQHLLSVPEEERAAEIQRIAPQLAQQGIPENAIANFAPTQRNLEFLIAQSRDIEKIREEARPRLRNVQAGDVVIDERNPGRGPVYESPFVEQEGIIYRRPQAMEELPRPRTPEEAGRLPPGTRFIDPNGVERTVPGGPQASPSAGNFPAGG